MLPEYKHDLNNPDPWIALMLDHSTFIDQKAKEALLRNNASKSRQFLLPVIRPIARLSIGVVQLVRIFVPRKLTSTKALHTIICWGMRYFVSRDANYLIFRHFHIGSQILSFLNMNLAGGTLQGRPLYPQIISDFGKNTFVQHDLNIYNFIIQLNTYLLENKKSIGFIESDNINFSAIQDFDGQIEELPNKWHNFLDLQSAIELYTPLFGAFLADQDFWRASNSLQLDETIALYVAKISNQPAILGLVSNKHPMVPFSTFEAGFRLMLHGLDAENLYGFIKLMRQQSQKQIA